MNSEKCSTADSPLTQSPLVPLQIQEQLQAGLWGRGALRWVCEDPQLPGRLADTLCINGQLRQQIAGNEWGTVQIARLDKAALAPPPETSMQTSACEPPETTGKSTPQANPMPTAHLLRQSYDRGYSIITNNLQDRSNLIAHLCQQLAKLFACGVNCNAYLTPPDAQALARHYDDEDIIVMQLSGHKRWQVWLPGDPQLLPLAGLPYSTHCATTGAPLLDTVLQPGDCLYLPAGHAHAAQTSGVPSLHITFSLAALCVADLLIPLMRQQLFEPDTGSFLRQRVPLSWIHEPDEKMLQAALSELRSGYIRMARSMSHTELVQMLASLTDSVTLAMKGSAPCPT